MKRESLTYSHQLACEYQREDKSTDRSGRSAHFFCVHQPSAGLQMLGGKETQKKNIYKKKIERKKEPRSFTPPGHRSGAMPAPFSHFSSLWRNPTAAPLRPTPGGTSSTGNADPFFTRSLFSLKKNRRRERERERLQTCSFFSFFFFLCPSPVRTETWDLVCG